MTPRPRIRSMLVCHCNGISDKRIRRVVREGAQSAAEVGRACGAGTCCQGCSPMINRIIQHESRHQAKSSAPTPESLGSPNS